MPFIAEKSFEFVLDLYFIFMEQTLSWKVKSVIWFDFVLTYIHVHFIKRIFLNSLMNFSEWYHDPKTLTKRRIKSYTNHYHFRHLSIILFYKSFIKSWIIPSKPFLLILTLKIENKICFYLSIHLSVESIRWLELLKMSL